MVDQVVNKYGVGWFLLDSIVNEGAACLSNVKFGQSMLNVSL